jgi:hypothetical protein
MSCEPVVPDPWEPPLPLAVEPVAPAFPLDALPTKVKTFLHDGAAALSCPVDYLAVPALALAGAALGASRALEIKRGYSERASLFAVIVGPPGSAKSPALKLVAAPFYAEQGRLVAEYRAARERYDEAEGERRGPPPKLTTAYVSDITTEKLAEVLMDSPRGVVMIRDELSAWIGSMDQYKARGRGADRQFFLSAWGGDPVSVLRKNQDRGPVFVAHPFLSVAGGIQPALLTRLRGEHQLADGFLDRLLFSFPEPPPAIGETWVHVPQESADTWAEMLRGLRYLEGEIEPDGSQRPRFVRLRQSGRKAWERFTGELAAEMNADSFPEILKGPWSKLRGYCARLALIVHYLRIAADEVTDEDVDGEAIDRAALIVRYFAGHARKAYHALDADPKVAEAKRVWEWIKREQRAEFKQWEAHKDLKSDSRFPTIDSLDAPLAMLRQHHVIRVARQSERSGPGRTPAPTFEVNPLALQESSGESGKSGK